MAVQEILGNLGSWEIRLDPEIPRDVLDALSFLGHVAVIPGRLEPAQYGDNLLAAGNARYVGVVRTRTWGDSGKTAAVEDDLRIGGSGMAFWLGDENGGGAVIENNTVFASAGFPTAIRGLLPPSGAVTEGTLYSVAGLYSATHRWVSSRKAIDYVCTTMGTPAAPLAWRVNNNATLDAGPASSLYVTTPTCVILPTGAGEDMAMRALGGATSTVRDVQDFTTRVILMAQGTGDTMVTGSANLAPGSNPYKDMHGNIAALTRMVSESATVTGLAATRAQLALNQYTNPMTNLTLSTVDYDVHGTFQVGDYVYVYDPDAGLIDTAVEITFRGQRLNPIKLQVTEADWSVTAGYSVAYRSATGVWTDLTRYVTWETDPTVSVVVGGVQRALTTAGTEPVGSRPNADTSVPGVPTLVTPFLGAAYLDSRGFTRARVRIQWNAPLNVDGSTILDGNHYDIRFAVDTDMIYPATWSAVSVIRWQDMQLWRQPFAAPTGQWQTMVVGWDQGSAQLNDLSPGIGYDVQIRAVDSSGHAGAWSPTTTFVATSDNIPPSTPDAPQVAASRIAVQVTHDLGRSSGGTFNLESDLDHLEIHAAYEPTFTPGTATLLGKLKANSGMIQAQIAAVGTYGVESTAAVYVRVVAVDISGNRSGPSDAASATALLIDDAHISDLTVSKVTAGTITASWVMAGEIKTADTGARMRISGDGFELYNAAGTRTMFGATADGSVSMIGQLSSGGTGSRIVVNPAGALFPSIYFYANNGTDFSFINAFVSGSDVGIGITSSPFTIGADTLTNRVVVLPNGAGSVMQAVDAATQAVKGGFTQDAAGFMETGYQYGAAKKSFYADSTSLRMFGNFIDSSSVGVGDEAIVAGGGSIATSGTFDAHAYTTTLPGVPRPMLTFNFQFAAPVRAWGLTNNSNSGFTASLVSASAAGATPYNFWVFKT